MLTHTHSSIHLLIIQRVAVAEGVVFPSCLSVHLSVCLLSHYPVQLKFTVLGVFVLFYFTRLVPPNYFAEMWRRQTAQSLKDTPNPLKRSNKHNNHGNNSHKCPKIISKYKLLLL